MKDITERFVNESLSSERYFVLRIKNGEHKDEYIYSDAEWWKTTKNISHAWKGKTLYKAKVEKNAADRETKGHYGDIDIIQVDVTYKVV